MTLVGNRRYDLSNPAIRTLVSLSFVRILKDIDSENQRRFFRATRNRDKHTRSTSFKHSSAQKAHVRVALGMAEGLGDLDLMHVQNPKAEMEIANAVTAYHQLRLDNDVELLKREALGDGADKLDRR